MKARLGLLSASFLLGLCGAVCAQTATGQTYSLNLGTFNSGVAGMASVAAAGYQVNASLGETFAAVSASGSTYSLGPAVASGVLVPFGAVSPSSVNFGSQTVGSASAVQNITISNTGAAPLDLGIPVLSGDFVAQVSTCGTELAAGQSCAIGVVFSPTVDGARAGSLTVSTNLPGGAFIVALSGTGQADPGAGGAGGSNSGDVPTLPEWGVILLGSLLLLLSRRRMVR